MDGEFESRNIGFDDIRVDDFLCVSQTLYDMEVSRSGIVAFVEPDSCYTSAGEKLVSVDDGGDVTITLLNRAVTVVFSSERGFYWVRGGGCCGDDCFGVVFWMSGVFLFFACG